MAKGFYGDGSIYYDQTNGSWIYKTTVELSTGRKLTKRICGKSRAALKRKVDKFKAELAAGKETNLSALTVGDWIEEWLRVYVEPTKIPRTCADYKARMSYVVPLLGGKRLDKLTPRMIQEAFGEIAASGGRHGQGIAPRSVNIIRAVLRQCLDSAVENGCLRRNPVKGTSKITERGAEKPVLDKEGVRRMLGIAKAWAMETPESDSEYLATCYYHLVLLGFATGMRIGELRGLRWSNVDFANNSVTVSKQLGKRGKLEPPKTSGSARTIVVSREVMRELQGFLRIQEAWSERWGDIFDNALGLVYTNSTGHPVNDSVFRGRYWLKLVAEAGAPDGFTIHCMRHTHATLLLQHGVNAKVVSERLGHADVSTTLRIYAHVLSAMEQTAADTWSTLIE